MKKCIFCAEEIQDEAIKCKHCGSMLDEAKPQIPWYFKPVGLIIAFLCVGPFALPLLWFNPRYSQKTKIVASVIVIALSIWFLVMLIDALKSINRYYQMIFQGNLGL